MAQTMNRNISVVKDEYAIFGKALPYVAMLIGGALLFILGLLTRLGIYGQMYFGHTDPHHSTWIVTWIVLVSAVILSPLAYKLFEQRKHKLKEPYIAWHATITTVLAHVWLIVALWQGLGHPVFGFITIYVYFFGALIVTLSWCLRRWSFRGSESTEHTVNPFEEIGLGKKTYLDSRNSGVVANGRKFRMNLELGKTIEQAKNARISVAQILGKPRNLVHISETDNGIEGMVDILVLDKDPFKNHTAWAGPTFPGSSIAKPIEYATYDDGTRPCLYLAGKDGNSCQHFLTMGMSGAGKSKAWQAIYGTVLNRSEVSVVFGDPAKGMQTGAALASGLEWFEFDEEGCLEQIAAIMRAIPARTDYLTSKGLGHWVPGCGLNFIIFHLEEAARFAEVDELIQMIEAARSAGISIIISLQRATNDRLKTSARYNLGGSVCFGVRGKRDAELALSEDTRKDGAEPHKFQDRKPGHHYLEALGIDPRMFAHELETDWVDEKFLEMQVDNGAQYRTELDYTTIVAFGDRYSQYKQEVYSNLTPWQKLRAGRMRQIAETQEIPAYREEIDWDLDDPIDKGALNTSGTPIQEPLFDRPLSKQELKAQETANAKAEVRSIVQDFTDNGVHRFGTRDVLNSITSGRSRGWVIGELKAMVDTGILGKDEDFYTVN